MIERHRRGGVPQVQYRLHGYVCGDACFRRPDVDGSLTLMMVYMKRPPRCRYAIVSEWNLNVHREEVLVWDLFEMEQRVSTGKLLKPDPVRRCFSVDQAVMATFLLYRED